MMKSSCDKKRAKAVDSSDKDFAELLPRGIRVGYSGKN
jgi:hypothetical protein